MTARKYTPDGFFEVARNPISRSGVFPYTARSVGLDGDPNRIVMVYRPREELDNPDTLNSAKLQPWVIDHTMLGDPAMDAGLTPPEKKGVHGVIGERVEYDATDGTMYANVRVWSPTLGDAIEAGKKELSMGFRCVYDFTPGVFQGQAYDAIQRSIRFNHLATVDRGRMGSKVAVLDHATFGFDAADLKVVSMKPTRRVALAAKLGVAVDALAAMVGMDGADADALAKWNAVMDADAEPDGDETDGNDPNTLSEAADVIRSFADPLKELTDALAALSTTPSDDLPESSVEDMLPVFDSAGAPVIDPATGKQQMKKNDATLTAMDAAIKALKATSKTAHAALNGAAPGAELVAMDAAIVEAEGHYSAAVAAHGATATSPALATALDALEQRVTAMDAKIPTAAAPTIGDMMKAIASRDALVAKVSPFIGAFDASEMDEAAVAKYAADKLELGAPAGSELATLNGYLKNRTVEAPRPASAFAVDAAVKTSSRAADYIAGKATAA